MRGLSNNHASTLATKVVQQAQAVIAWGCFSVATSVKSPSNTVSVNKESEVEVQRNRSIQQIRAEIFGEPIRPGEKDGRSILARRLQGKELASWYFLPPTESPGFHNEEKE